MHKISLAAEPIAQINSFTLTNSALTATIVSLTIILLFLALRKKISLRPIKSATYEVVETVLEYLYTTFTDVLGSRQLAREFFPLLTTFFIFIILNNWFGLLPGIGTITLGHYPLLRGGNADLNTTLALALISVLATGYYGIKHTGFFNYWKKFFNFSSPIMFFVGILELISELAKVISFSFRLFGNIFAGEVLLLVIAFLVPLIAPLPFFGLEMFVGLVQALVFMMLTLVFLKIATAENHLKIKI